MHFSFKLMTFKITCDGTYKHANTHSKANLTTTPRPKLSDRDCNKLEKSGKYLK